MDKLAIVMGNYIDAECDANTTPRQAYERGFRRATKKCETVMHSRKIEKEKFAVENDRLKAENRKLRDYAYALEECKREAHYCEFCPHFSWEFEDVEPHCDFDFDALRAAAGMEVDE